MALRRVTVAVVAAILLGGAAWYFLKGDRHVRVQPPSASRPLTGNAARAERKAPAETPPTDVAANPLAAELNAPAGSIRRDLAVLNEIFVNFQTNFPRAGNPVGENVEITAALTGDNSAQFAFIPKNHPAINPRGELCDRWGTPFRFHQLSGQVMEIRSAGPDGRFGTADDSELSPTSPVPVLR